MRMMESKAKKKRGGEHKVFYIIFSIVASIALWMYVAYVENPEKPVTISGIQIVYSGEDLLKDNNLVVTSVNAKTLSVKFSGKRNTVSKLSNDNVSATVDLSGIVNNSAGTAGVYQLSYKLKYDGVSSTGITVTSASLDYVTVTVEKLVTAPVTVKTVYDGGVAEGYTAEAPESSVSTITVSGPQTEVSKISYALAKLDRANLSKSVTEEVPLVLVDAEGNKLTASDLTLSQDSVNVTVTVLMVKEVPLSVNLVYGASASESNTKVVIEPSSVTLSGDAETLTGINQLVLGTIDLTSFATSEKETFKITLPNEVNNVSGESSADVSVTVIGMTTKRLSTTNIEVKNVSASSTATVITQSLDVSLRGSESSVNAVLPENVRISADLTDLGTTTGTYTVAATVYVDGYSDVDAIGEYKITVTLAKK